MVTHIRERVPVRIISRSENGDGDASGVDLVAERSMGVLRHPVPRSEMLHKVGVDERGCKVVLYWHQGLPEQVAVKPGDELEIAGTCYRILGSRVCPGYYIEIYTAER